MMVSGSKLKLSGLVLAILCIGSVCAFGQEDIYEPDNNFLLASTTTVDLAELHTIFPANDEDWFYFIPQTGHVYRIETSAGPDFSGGIDTVMELWNEDVTVQYDANDDGVPGTFFSRIEYTAVTTNKLHIKVDLNLSIDVGDYYLEISDLTGAGGGGSGVVYPPYELTSVASNTAVVMDDDGRPVIAYTDVDTNGIQQVYLIRWNDDIEGALGDWVSLLGKWSSADGSAGLVDQVSSASLWAGNPSVDVDGNDIYVAWLNKSTDDDQSRVFLSRFSGGSWSEVAGSMTGSGVSAPPVGIFDNDCLDPIVKVTSGGTPIVAYQDAFYDGVYNQSICVLQNLGGTNAWLGLDGSTNGIVTGGEMAANPTMDLDSGGNPIVAWGEISLGRIRSRRWSGSSWVTLCADIGSAPYAEKPKIAVSGSSAYMAWNQYYTDDVDWILLYDVNQVNVVQTSIGSGTWSDIGGAYSPLGISAAPSGDLYTPTNVSVAVDQITGNPSVSWVSGTGLNSVFLRTFNGVNWVERDGSATGNGIPNGSGSFTASSMTVDEYGYPTITFVDGSASPFTLDTYTLVASNPPAPPIFPGVKLARAETNGGNFVYLEWPDAEPPYATETYTSVTYNIYRSTRTSWVFADEPTYSSDDIFVNGVFVGSTNILISQLTNSFLWPVPAADLNRVWGFGVRAVSPNSGMVEDNTAIRYAGVSNYVAPSALPTSDTDGDGLDDTTDPAPNDPDANDNGISDSEERQAGYTDAQILAPNVIYDFILSGDDVDFTGGEGGWTHTSPVDLWHITTADPSPPTGTGMNEHTGPESFRCAKNVPANDTSTTYGQGTAFVRSALDSPAFAPGARENLFVTWNEYYETESQWDICKVAVSDDGLNWTLVRPGVSGNSGGWQHRRIDITEWWRGEGSPAAGVQVRFEFQTLNNINNEFGGWYVDDVNVSGTPEVTGRVRSASGQPLVGAVVYAIGRGGVTNTINGHTFVDAGEVYGLGVTDVNGDYELRGMPEGRYYIKAVSEGYKAEFWDGQLFPGAYLGAYGNPGVNPGKYDVRDVSVAGWLDLTAASQAATCNFELDPGLSRGSLVVQTPAGIYSVYLNQGIVAEQIWNGTATTNGAAFINYTTDMADTDSFPNISWSSSPSQPPEISDLQAGEYEVFLYPGWAGAPEYSKIMATVREGEKTKIIVGSTLASGGQLNVLTENDAVATVYVNGRPTSYTTPTSISGLQAGVHDISLVAGGPAYAVQPKSVTMSTSGIANLYFSADEISGTSASAYIRTYDVQGTEITGASIYINGFDTGYETPATISGLMVGSHKLGLRANGYMTPPLFDLTILAGQTAPFTATLRVSDRDYDSVGDSFEVSGYTNIFRFDDNDDPDADGVSNFNESEQFRIHGIRMNVNSSDTDSDGMTDGDEFAYDGLPNSLSIGTLAANVSVRASWVAVMFQGSYLAGDCFFPATGPVSIEGDRFWATGRSWTIDAQGNLAIIFTANSLGDDDEIVSVGHNLGDAVFADPVPDVEDTDSDGMWDGYEFLYESVDGIDVLDNNGANDDPDLDGLTNLREFLGVNNTASGDSDDWSNPGLADSDSDGIPDGWEYEYGLNPLNSADTSYDEDLDGPDGLTNFEEWQHSTDPHASDTDNDFVLDGAEVKVYMTDPLSYDTDLDGLWDGQEVIDTDLNADNGLDRGFFPNWSGDDFDSDGTMDGPTDWDTDGDGMPDGFEVLTEFPGTNDMRVIRDWNLTLNPMDPLDGTADEDNDGLSNLEEYLVRDNLTGINPAGLLWDYSSDPFDPDSDDDGMPDGWEVWRGLHPQDPIPSVRTETEYIVRQHPYWRYGDLDGDGLENIAEYEMRFVVDPDADKYSIEGSADPWDPDSDDDGLPDGEELKTYRSNPMNQDTDGDGLIDGIDPAGLRQGEVNSSWFVNAGGHYDRALNDIWKLGKGVVYQPLTESHWIGYNDFMPDGPQQLHPVYRDTNTLGLFAIDLTNAPMTKGWSLGATPAAPTGPPAYSWGVGLQKDPLAAGFNDNPGRGQGLLSFYIDVQQAGTYNFRLYNMATAVDNDEDTVWINIDFGSWKALQQNPDQGSAASTDIWSWKTVQSSGLSLSQYLSVGLHRIYISGRGNGFNASRLLLYDATIGSAAEVADLGTQATLVPDPTATLSYSLPDRPERRWGAKAANIKFTITDDENGTYVGAPVGLNVKWQKKQTLIRTDQLVIVGGRDGGTFYDQIWVMKGMTDWFLDPTFGNIDPFWNFSAGESELLVFPLPQVCPAGPGNWGPAAGLVRPRPGVAPAYQYYDADKGTDPAAIWGESGENNMVPMGYFTGFDDRYGPFIYYPFGNNTKEAVEKWNLPYNNNAIPYYLHEDDFSGATYAWEGGNAAWQGIVNGVSTNAPNERIWSGAFLWHDIQGALTNQSIVGLQCDNVLNTKDSSDGDSLRVALSLVAGYTTNTSPMEVEIFAELSLRDLPSVPQPSPHKHWTSNQEYGQRDPADLILLGVNAIDTDFTPLRRWNLASGDNFMALNESYYKTTNMTYTIPVMKEGEIAGIDVSGLVADIFRRNTPSGSWELGGDIGFVIKPVATGTTNQFLISDHWLTVYADAPYWEWPAAAGYWVGGDTFSPKYTPNNIDIVTTVTGAENPTFTPFPRKSSANVIFGDGLLMFGGVDGNNVLDDTWTSDGLLTTGSTSIAWSLQEPVNRPAGRWGHGMAAVANGNTNGGTVGAVMFGGFDVNNEPLNDLWFWDSDDANWFEITNFANIDSGTYIVDPNRPRPRGGHVFAAIGGRPALFGGTDGQFYFNDGWVLQVGANPNGTDLSIPDENLTPWRWILANPYGERSGTPPPRAFAAYAGGYMFGGRTGTLPTSTDTDDDWVDDGIEHSLGGPDAGRDPRVNALYERTNSVVGNINWNFTLNTNAQERVPYAFQRLGGYSYEDVWYTIPGQPADSYTGSTGPNNVFPRGAIADFEALSFSHERNNGDFEWECMYGGALYSTPIQGHRMPSPTITGFDLNAGYDSIVAHYTNLWYRPSNAPGSWELGPPQSGTPAYARSGRWCYGTDLKNYYRNNAVEELYSPLMQLTLPQDPENTTDPSNNNGLYLVFHEFLDLADSGDNVRVEAVRPTTGADIVTRVSGVGRPAVTVLPDRNNAHNTTDGKWRRVAVSLATLLNQENVYFRFVFESDSAGRANGWFIDDVAVMQAGEISGATTMGNATVYLFGEQSAFGTNNVINNPLQQTVSDAGGGFGFSGLIPAGNYKLLSETGSSTTTDVSLSGSWDVTGLSVDVIDEILVGITVNSPALLAWNAIPGVEYLVMYATPASLATASPWQFLTSVTPTTRYAAYRDEDSDGEQSRYYKIIMVN